MTHIQEKVCLRYSIETLFIEYEASLWNLIYQSYSESFSKEELSQLEFIAKETGRTKSEVLKDLIKRESHLLYYGYYSR